jgi:hypothetical protein
MELELPLHEECGATKSDDLKQCGLGGVTLRQWLSAVSSLFEHLCERNAVTHNPAKGVELCDRTLKRMAGRPGLLKVCSDQRRDTKFQLGR